MNVAEVNAETAEHVVKDVLLDDDVLAWHLRVDKGGSLVLYREWVGGRSPRGLLYTNSYSRTHSYLRYLATVAKKANPSLKDNEIEHSIINNASRKGVMTCEFPCPEKPVDWTQINSLPGCYVGSPVSKVLTHPSNPHVYRRHE